MKRNIFISAKDALIRLIFPPRCAACNEVIPFNRQSELCETCADRFYTEEHTVCDVCGKTAPQCRCRTLDYGRIPTVLMFYTKNSDTVSEKLVFNMKDDKTSNAHKFFARELSREILRSFGSLSEDPNEWIITFPPRSTEKLRERGFDQGEKLAGSIAEFTGMTFCRLFSRADSREQKSLNSRERAINASETIMLLGGIDLNGKKIMIVDDIITTGATMNAAVRLLESAGAKEIFTAAIFRTMPKNSPCGTQISAEPLWFEQ